MAIHVLEQGRLRLVINPALGGRVVSLQVSGEELLFMDADVAPLDVTRIQDRESFQRNRPFPITGGSKTWVAPQSSWKYGLPPLDIDSGAYKAIALDPKMIELESPVCRETEMRIRRKISVLSENVVQIEEWGENTSLAPKELAVWSVIQMLRPWKLYLSSPLSGLRPYEFSTSKALWPERASSCGKWSYVDVTTPGEFKFGGVPQEVHQAYAACLGLRPYASGLAWGVFFESSLTGRYAHDSSFEVYNHPSSQKDYFEIEFHPQLTRLEPGQASYQKYFWVFLPESAGGTVGLDEPSSLLKRLALELKGFCEAASEDF